jgi:hypothetical protein
VDITGKKQKKRHCGASILFYKKAPETAKENLHKVRCPAITLKKIRAKTNTISRVPEITLFK